MIEAGHPSRRGVLLGAGAVGAGMVVAACGGKEAPPSGGQSAGSESKAASPSVKTAEVPVGGGVVLPLPEASDAEAQLHAAGDQVGTARQVAGQVGGQERHRFPYFTRRA